MTIPTFRGPSGTTGTPFVVIGLEPAGTSAADDAIALIGGEVIAHLSPHDAPVALEATAGAPAVVLDLLGVDDASAYATVAAIDALTTARAWRLVIAMSVAQIDPVVAALSEDSIAQLLCTPDQAEWIGALAVAAARGDGRVRDPESEAERLTRLNAEVARIADLLARLGGAGDGGGGHASDRRTTFAMAPSAIDVSAGAVRDVIRARRMRDRFFGDGLFEDPAWDMLLDLFAAQLEDVRVSVSSLCIAAAVAPTTALRWVGKLTAAGLLLRAPDPSDGRRAFIGLSEGALGSMHRYVAALSEARLPLI